MNTPNTNWGMISDGFAFEALMEAIVFAENPTARLFGKPGKDQAMDARSADGAVVYQAKYIRSSAITMNRVLKANVKLEELFKCKGERLRFGSVLGNDALMIKNFRWSYLVSYKARNVIVHDGGYLFEKPLFELDSARGTLVLSSEVEKMFDPEPESEQGVEFEKERSEISLV